MRLPGNADEYSGLGERTHTDSYRLFTSIVHSNEIVFP